MLEKTIIRKTCVELDIAVIDATRLKHIRIMDNGKTFQQEINKLIHVELPDMHSGL